MGTFTIREATPQDTGLIYGFILKMARYEKLESEVDTSEEALRRVIAAFQTNQIDYSVFSTDMAEQIRAQSGAVTPLIQQFGALKTIEHRGQQSGADMFRVVFEKQATDWVIAFDDQDQIAALLFRPAQD